MAEEHLAEKHPWEWWSRVAIGMLVIFVIAWLVIFLRLGLPSVYSHAIVVPGIGFLTVPMMFFGLLRTVFRPPAIRRDRTIAFGSLLFMGVFGTVPLFAPPLSTDDWTAKTSFRLPFDGEWMATAGGPDRDRNYHVTTPAYRYGYDFTRVEGGVKFRMDGARNEDYFCFGEPILAPAAGTIHDVENAQSDNTPGEVPASSTLGNYVILKVDDAYLFFAHLKEGSVQVAPGEAVQAGQQIAACGNSGRSIEPHLHFHAQNSPDFPYAESLPLKFSSYEANGKPVELGMPIGSNEWEKPNGQIVRTIP